MLDGSVPSYGALTTKPQTFYDAAECTFFHNLYKGSSYTYMKGTATAFGEMKTTNKLGSLFSVSRPCGLVRP